MIAVILIPCVAIALLYGAFALLARLTPGTADALRRRQAASPLAHELPYWQVRDDGVLIGVDGTYSAGLRLCGLDTDCLADTELSQLDEQLHSLLRTLDEGVCLQWIHLTDHDHRALLERYRDSARAASGIGETIAREKIAAVTQLSGLRRSRLYVVVSTPNPRSSAARRMGVAASFPTISPAQHTDACAALARLVTQLRHGLEAMRVSATPLSGAETRALIYEFINPSRHRVVPCPTAEAPRPGACPARFFAEQTAREQLCFAGISEHESTLSLDGRLVRVVTLRSLPNHTDSAFLERLTVELPFACRVTLSVDVLAEADSLAALKRAQKRAHALLVASARDNPEAEAQYEDLAALLRELIAGSARMTEVALSVVLSVPADEARAAERLQQQTDEVLRVLAALDGAQGMIESYAQLDSFLATLPGNARHYRRAHLCTSQNATHLLLAWQSWCGSETPAVLVQNGRDYLVGIDPFAPHLNNPNAFMAGVSGSGKSVTTNYLLMHLFASGCKGLIIDVGGSYRRLLKLFGGDYISLTDDPALNLFHEPGVFYDAPGVPNSLRLGFILAVLETLLVDSDQDRLRNEERSVLDVAVRAIYEGNERAPLLGELRTFLDTASFEYAEDTQIARLFARRLRYWTTGPHARLLNRPSTIHLTTAFCGFDLKGLPDEVQAPVLLILSSIIWNLVTRDDTERKCVVFDEVWSFLRHPAAANMLAELYRTTRKYRCSILAISQSVEDFTGSSVATALVNNSATKYLLKHDLGHEVIAETFHLNPREAYVFRGLEMRAGQFSELLLMSGRYRFLARIVLTPLEYWISTTHPADRAAMQALQRETPDQPLLTLLLECAARWPRGAANHRTQRLAA